MKTPKVIKEKIKEIVWREDNPYYGMEYRKVWEGYIGEIPPGQVIHHINGKKRDNRIENLQCLSPKEHGFAHRKEDRIRIKYPQGIKVIKINKNDKKSI